ncbi:UNVERIFIED_CONTAM: hypothetical protein FKN15_006797 [Acipenser sinensis]
MATVRCTPEVALAAAMLLSARDIPAVEVLRSTPAVRAAPTSLAVEVGAALLRSLGTGAALFWALAWLLPVEVGAAGRFPSLQPGVSSQMISHEMTDAHRDENSLFSNCRPKVYTCIGVVAVPEFHQAASLQNLDYPNQATYSKKSITVFVLIANDLHILLLDFTRGSAIARIIGSNVQSMQKFASTIKMWVFEETVNGRKLTEVINTDHENVKYLPGYKLPENVVAVPELQEAAKDADLLVFVVPHQFIGRLCDQMVGCVSQRAVGISLIKGIDEGPNGLKLISDIIREKMGIDVSVLMGANIANEVAAEKFCETTIGSKNMAHGLLFKELLQTPNFRITVVDDADTVELCGALKALLTATTPALTRGRGGAKMNTRCPPKHVPSAACFFTLCRLTVQPPQSYSVGGQRSSGQLTGKPASARPDYRGRWCANIVAVGAGFCDGLRCGDNTKAAVIRLGLMEMIAFAKIFSKEGSVSSATFLESCGVADLITTCYGGRNRRVAEAFAKTGKGEPREHRNTKTQLHIDYLALLHPYSASIYNASNSHFLVPTFPPATFGICVEWSIEELEQEILNGQKLQGPQTSAEVYNILKQKGLVEKFPLFTSVYQICYEGKPVLEMISCLQSHPEHM